MFFLLILISIYSSTEPNIENLQTLEIPKQKMGLVDWSILPSELVEIIVVNLTDYIDYVRFRAVCVNWRSFTSPKPNHLPTQFPCLMLPFGRKSGVIRAFYDHLEKSFHRLTLPETCQRRCCGSSQGWLVFIEERCASIFLLNPLTRIQIQLPPITSFPNVLSFNIQTLGEEYLVQDYLGERLTYNLKVMRDFLIKKIVLSSSPENNYIAVAILDYLGVLAFCKKGMEEWLVIEDAHLYTDDVIYFNGFFYAVDTNGSIAVCDLSGISPVVVTLIRPPQLLLTGSQLVYLVNSFGELLLVFRYLDGMLDKQRNLVYQTVRFKVFKLRLESSREEWVEMENLGDRLLFLGVNSSLCLRASDFARCEGNRIYFTYEYLTEVECCPPNGGVNGRPDSGVYNLEDRSIEPLPYNEGGSRRFMPLPIWFTPNSS